MRAAAGRGEWPRVAATRKPPISNSNPLKNHRFPEPWPVKASGHERPAPVFQLKSFRKPLIWRATAGWGERPLSAGTGKSLISNSIKSFRRCLFAVASFMLALIGLKKFRSFQKPNRIDVLEDKTRRVGAGSGVARSVAESRESGGRLQSRFGGPEAKKKRFKTLDLSATLINSWPSSVEGFFPCLAYP